MTKLQRFEFRARRKNDDARLDEWLRGQGAALDHNILEWPVRCTSWCAWLDGEPQLHFGVANAQVFWKQRTKSLTCIGRRYPEAADERMQMSLLTTIFHHLDRSSPQPCVCFFPPPAEAQMFAVSRERRFLPRSEWFRLPSANDCIEVDEIHTGTRGVMKDLYLLAARAWDGALCRDGEYWQTWKFDRESDDHEIVLLEPGDQGYGRIRRHPDQSTLEILEIASTNAWHDLVILSGIVSTARSLNAQRLEIKLPPNHGLWEALARLGCVMQREAARDDSTVWIRLPSGDNQPMSGDLDRFAWNAADWLD